MTNLNTLLLTAPVWRDEEDTGGMFPSTLKVHLDPSLNGDFVASFTDGWRVAVKPTRHATLEEAQKAARTDMHVFFGLED